MAKKQTQKNKSDGGKSRVKLRMSMEEARELFGGELPQAVPKPQKKKGIDIDYKAISLAIVVAAVIFFLLALYFSMTTGKNLIEPLQATPITIAPVPEKYSRPVNEIQAYWNQNEITRADNAIGAILNRVQEDDEELAKRLFLLRLRARVIQKDYEQAQQLAQVLRSTYRQDQQVMAKVMWYRGLCYYYQEQYYQAVSMFEQVAGADVEMSERAAEYAEEIRSFSY